MAGAVNIGDIEARLKLNDELTAKLSTVVRDLQKRMSEIEAATKKPISGFENLASSARKAGQQMSDIGSKLTALTLPLAALGGLAIKTAIDFESSFAGVRKTVDASNAELAAMAQQFRDLSKEIPVNVNELNKIGEAAGQLGIAKQDIIDFTRTMADLANTTDLTSDAAATMSAQFQNIFGAAGKEVDRFGSTLVALGNAGASTESQILQMGLRIAGAGSQIGLTQGEVLAFASALSSVGIEAEAGGSAISKIMIDIALAVSKGGRELQNFAGIAGASAEDFKKAFKDDAAAAVEQFISGLGRLQASGGDVLKALDAMGITEVRMRDALLRASSAGDLLKNSLNLQAKAWKENNALTEEAKKRYETFDSQLKIFVNKVRDVGITVGTSLLPVLRDLLTSLEPTIKLVADLARRFSELPQPARTATLVIASIVVVAGPVILVLGKMVEAFGALVAVAPKVATFARTVASSLGGLPIVILAVGLAVNRLVTEWKQGMDRIIGEMTRFQGEAAKFLDTEVKLRKAQKLGFVDVADLQSASESIGAITRDIKGLQESWVETRKKLSEEHNYWTKKDLETESQFIESEIKLQTQRKERLQKLLGAVGGLPHPVTLESLQLPPPLPPIMPSLGGGGSGTTNTIDQYNRLIESLHSQAEGVREVISAYADGTVAGERMSEQVDRQTDALQQASEFTGTYRDNIYSAVTALGELQAYLEGVIRAAELKQRIDDAAALSDTRSLIDLARVRGELEKQARVREAVGTATGKQSKKLKELAEQSFDDDQRLAAHELQIQYEATNKALEDWISTYAKGITAVDSLTREQEVEAEVTQHLLSLHGAMPDKLDKEIRKRLELNRTIQALKEISSLASEAEFSVKISGLDLGTRLGRLEEQYLSFARNIGQGSVEIGEQVIQDLSDRFLALTGIYIDFADQIRASLSQIDDSQTVARVRDSVRSPLNAYREERANIERLMASSTDSVRISTEDGLAYINRITADFWSEQINNWAGVLNQLADTFGGVFKTLAQVANTAQSAMQTYQTVSSAVSSMGGSASMAQGWGAFAAYIQIIVAAYEAWSSHKKRRQGRVFENDQPTVRMQGGMWNDGPLSDGWAGTFTSQLSQRSYDIARKIQQTADAFAESIGGTLASFTDLEIKIRRDGEKIRAYVAGAFVGEFNEIEEAISAAMAVAFADPKTTFRGLTELVQQALDQVVKSVNIGGIGGSAEAMQDWLVQIREIAQIQWSQAAVGAGDTVRHLESLWKALAKVTNITPAVIQGFQDLATSEIRAFQDWADSISGRERTNAEILADKERDRDLFIAQRALRIAELELRKIELQQLRAGVQSRANIDAAGGRLDNIRIQWRQGVLDAEGNLFEYEAGLRDASLRGEWGYATARAEIIGAEISLTQQYTDAVAAQIAAIDAILAGLAAIPIPEIGLGRGGSSTGRNIADERRDFRDSLRDIIGSLLPDIEADFYSLQQRIRDLQEEARRLKIPVSELAPALAALRREFQEELLARANDLAGIGTGFTARLQEGLDFFRSLEELGRANTGIPDWLREILEGRFLEQMRADWQSRVDSFRGLENPMLEIQARANELQQDLLALAQATGMTAEQIAAAQAQISEGVEFQRLSAVNGLLDRVFGYLRTSADFADETMAFERAKIEAEFRLMEAQFRFLGAWDETTAAWLSAAREIAFTQLEAPVEEITTAASGLTDAANAQKSVIDRWRSAIDSWNQYRESLRNDSSLGMVNSREALNNTRALYESLRDRALGGDVEAAERLTQAAEDYRRNLIAFSPSSELVSSVLRSMDALNLGNLAPRVDPVVSGLSSIHTAITTQTTEWANHFASQTANDNTWTNHIADTTATHLTLVQDKQQRTTDEIVGLRGDVRDLNSNILSWRSEARETSGNVLGVEKEIRDETQRMIANMARVIPLAATPK